MSKVTDVSKKDLSVSNVKDGSAGTLTPDKNTDLESYSNGRENVTKLSSISVNDIVISVSDVSGSPSILKSVFDIGTPN